MKPVGGGRCPQAAGRLTAPERGGTIEARPGAVPVPRVYAPNRSRKGAAQLKPPVYRAAGIDTGT